MADADIVIVGGGAAGLAAGIFAAQSARRAGAPRKIAILDGAKALGAKILVSGGGRCNVTHDVVRAGDFNGNQNIIRNVLARFDADATVTWFEEMGVRLKREETGKLFPASDSAKTVLAALLRRCDELGVLILTGHRVTAIEGTSPFTVVHERGRLTASRLILATGGQSLPKTGSDGAGWEMARRLGHQVTEIYPALVPLTLDERFFHAELSGLSCEVELSVFADGTQIDRRTGSLLWTHFGVSGPVVMDASRHWVIAKARGQSVRMRCSFFPGSSMRQMEERLVSAAKSRLTTASAVIGRRLPDRLSAALLRHAGVEPAQLMSQVPRERRRALAEALAGLALPVARDRGWNHAEVTAGGVPLVEINYRTMESRRMPGLHLVGEMLDCDGRIGGFNFQWAWASGCVAGRAAACPGETRGRRSIAAAAESSTE